MKKYSRILSFILIVCMLTGICSCAAADAGPGGFEMMGGAADMPTDAEDSTGESDKEGNESNKDEVKLPAGMITAGAWDDNDNYQMWVDLFCSEDDQTEVKEGKFHKYDASQKNWGFNSLNRVKVNVNNGGVPVAGASVVAYSTENEPLFSAVSDAQGNAYLFVLEEEGSVVVTCGEASATAAFDKENRDLEIAIDDQGNKLNVIEIMFVVDVTGSMGDEISFLKAELNDVINRIAENDSETEIKLAFLFYRDLDDKVPFYYCDFMDVTDPIGLEFRQSELNKQYANGGGDYEEAVDEALEMAVNKQWSTGTTTKLIFHILDAPAHSGKQYEETFHDAVIVAAEKGIRICPILCSGAAEITEYTMRQASIYTGGTFIFVTNDSGIGNDHHDPEIPNVTVELLNSMLVRLVKGYHTGEFEDPIYWKDDQSIATQN